MTFINMNSKYYSIFCLTVIGIQCALMPVAFAQDRSGEAFFGKDFAKSPVTSDGDEDSAHKETPDTSKSSNSSSGSDQDDEELSRLGDQEVLSVSLIVNGLDKSHFENQLATYFSFISSHNLPPGDVYQVGKDSLNMDRNTGILFARSAFVGANLLEDKGQAKNFHVTKSPSWLVELKQGTVVLEGLASPDRFITAKNKFNPPDAGLEVKDGVDANVTNPQENF